MNESRPSSWMLREALQVPEVIAAQLQANTDAIDVLSAELRARPPRFVATCARGSSDHAATYGKYLIETRLGFAVSSVSPSVSSVYGIQPRMRDALFIAISQSGRSPDLIAATDAARKGGARIVAIVNDTASPLAERAAVVLPIGAGTERSVAATKTCLGAMSVLYQLVAAWRQDAAMQLTMQALPDALQRATREDWSPFVERLSTASTHGLFVLGRGAGLSAAQEMALKLKETCGLHAEALSAAEVKHGPMALIGEDFPVIALLQPDASTDGTRAVCDEFEARGAQVLRIEPDGLLPLPAGADSMSMPLLALQAFYKAVEALARRRGFDPDAPPHLNKVTRTQ